jgi:hypothetical protein
MVTKNQKEMLDNLTNVFESLNSDTAVEGSVIDVAGMLNEHEANKKRLAEIKANNDVMEELRDKEIAKWTEILNADLNKLGLKASVGSYYIRIDSIGHTCSSTIFSISLGFNRKYESLGDRCYDVYTELIYECGEKYNNMNDLLNDTEERCGSFKYKLHRLFNYKS